MIVTVGAVPSNVTVLSVLVEAVLANPVATDVTVDALMTAVTVPGPVMPETETVYVGPEPEIVAVVAPAVPLSVTSLAAKPDTASLNTTVNSIGLAFVGSA